MYTCLCLCLYMSFSPKMFSTSIPFQERTDQLVFDVLRAQERWDTIVAFAQDATFAKKRLVSRQSRYSGLSDLLEV